MIDHRVEKFVKRGRDMVHSANAVSMPPSARMETILKQIDRLQKLAYLPQKDRDIGLKQLWAYYKNVQDFIDHKSYTQDESWGNAKKGHSDSPEPGVWSTKNNQEVDFQTYGDVFEDLIDATIMPDGRTKVKTSEY